MIAKVLRSGSGFSGVIDYLYEGKLENRKADDKRAEVILHSDNLRVPRDWQDVAGRGRMKADFIEQAQSHRLYKTRGKDLIGEHVLSFTQDDMRKLRTMKGVRQVAAEYVKMLGMEQTQHVAIMHRDTDNPHLHLLFNRVTNDRKKFNDSWEKKRAVGAGVALAQKYDLHLVGGLSREAREPRARTMRAGMEDLKAMQAQQPVFSQARNLHHLEKLAAKQGLEIEKSVDRIKIGGLDYKLSDLDAMFQANRNAVAAEKKSAARGTAPTPAPDPKQETLRAQEREELFSSLGMGQFEAKARRMGIDIQKEPEHLTFNGERYETNEIETHLAKNFEQAQLARQQHARQIAELKAKAGENTRQARLVTAFQPHPLMRDATSMEGLEQTASHRGIESSRDKQYLNLDGAQYPLAEVEAMLAENKHRADTYRVANGLAENPEASQPIKKESSEKRPPDNAPRHAAMPRDPETAAYLEEYNIKSVALETATSMDELKKLCQQEGAFFAVGEHFTKVGDQSVRNEWMEAVMAENAKRQQNRPIQVEITEEPNRHHAADIAEAQESPERIAAQMALLETRLNATVAELTSARAQLATLEAQSPQVEGASQETEEGAEPDIHPKQEVPFKDAAILSDAGERDLLNSDSMNTFLDRAKDMAWSVREDEKNITVNGETYLKAELETEFTANEQEFHDSLRSIEPLLQSAQNLDQLRTQAYEAGVEMQVLGVGHPKVHLGEERYALETVEAILKENDAAQNVHRQRELELRPGTDDLFKATTQSDFVGRAKQQGMEVEVDPGRSGSVRIGGVAYDKEELDAVFSANVDEQRQAMHQREPILQTATSMMELEQAARQARAEFSVSRSDPDRPVVRLNGRTYEQDEINAMLYMNANPQSAATPKGVVLDDPSLLLGGRGTSCNSVHHLTLLADKMDIEVRVNKDTIQTRDRGEGTLMTFDRKRLEDIFAANQAARLAEIRRQLPVLNQAQSTRDFEELAQKLKVDYKTVQLTEYEIEVRRGKAMVRAGRDTQAKGEEEMKTGREQHRVGQARLRAARAEQSKAGDTPELAERKGRVSEPVRQARQTVLDAQTSVSEGVALMGQGRARHTEGRQQIAEGNKIIADAEQKREQENKSLKKGIPTAGTGIDSKKAVEERKPSLLERMKETAAQLNPKLPGTDYKINRETKLVAAQGKEGAVELQRGDLRAIFEENKKISLNAAYEQRRGSRILQEAKNFSEFYRMAGRLEIKLGDKGRTIEMQGHEYQKNDLKQLFRLNAENPANLRDQEFDHRQKGGKKREAEHQSQKQDNRPLGLGKIGHGAEQARKADPIRPTPQPKQQPRRRRPGKKKTPDYLQKLARQKQQQSRSQSHSL